MTDFTENVHPAAQTFVYGLALLRAEIDADTVSAQDGLASEACGLLLNYIATDLGPNNLNFIAHMGDMDERVMSLARFHARRALGGQLQEVDETPEEYWGRVCG